MTRIETCAIVYQPPRVLLAMKNRGFGEKFYNGLGGGIEEGESLEECVNREVFQEAGIVLINPERVGRILFQFKSDEQDHLVHFFRANQFSGTPEPSKEMTPEWFDEDKIPYKNMWQADKYWLPVLLAGKKFSGRFVYDKKSKDGICFYKLKEVENLS